MSSLKTETIKNLCLCYAGGTPSRSREEYFKGNIAWVSSGEVNSDKIYETKEYITQEALRNSSTKMIPSGAILVAMYGATAGQISKLLIEATSNQAVLAVIPGDKLDADYLFYSLKHLASQIVYLAQGSGQPNLSKELVERTVVSFPKDKTVQTKIAKILTTLDNVIEKTEEAIAKYEAIKQGMMHDLFTRGIGKDGKLRPSHQDAPELYKESELGWIPKDWDVESIEEIAEIRVSNVDKKTYLGQQNVFLCNYMDVYNNRFIKNGLPFMESTASADEIRKFKLEIGDVIITKDSETPYDIAMPAVIHEDLEDTVCGYHLSILRPDPEKVQGTLLMYNLCLPAVNRQFMTKANGSTRYGLTKDTIESAKVFKPRMPEQEQIVERLNSIEAKIQSEGQALAKQTRLKQGLMQDLLTGKVSVKPDPINV